MKGSSGAVLVQQPLLAGALGQRNKAVGTDVVGNAEAFPGCDIHVVAVQFMSGREADCVNDDVNRIPVLLQVSKYLINFFVGSDIAGKGQGASPAFGKSLYRDLSLSF